ncbi:uncharacterized protein LOC106172417 [Lingula anatina]|uniref:Uncharacterized protein LOC106172417 n=1 Tax=Lingula anatina TaxID=7574 RepID=A0A1S3JDT8_LINAN|nr:uncharacterized protein LOC106172417 [Lingula anatina]|eukprot:XP_013408575.1 uncharacterized protein LOC106172417 [Lingula anatina]
MMHWASAVLVLHFTDFCICSPLLPMHTNHWEHQRGPRQQQMDYLQDKDNRRLGDSSFLIACLGNSENEIEKAAELCGRDLKCLENHLSNVIFLCLSKRDMSDVQELKLETVLNNENSFLPCMFQCLGKSLPEIFIIWGECRENISCWAQKIGGIVRDCLSECNRGVENDEPNDSLGFYSGRLDDETLGPKVEAQREDITDLGAGIKKVDLKFIKCVASCLKTNAFHIWNIFRKCKYDFHCYAIELGKEALSCVESCIVEVGLVPGRLTWSPGPVTETKITLVRMRRLFKLIRPSE